MKSYIRRWWKCFKENKRFMGLRYAIRTELLNIWGVRKLNRLWWAILHRTTKKFHVVKLDLKPGYYDVDTRLVHANFCLLAHYVEKEHPFETVVWDDTDEHKQAAKEIKELYTWWKEVYPKYDDNNPLYADDVKAPDHEFVVHSVDEDGDPKFYRMEDKPGQEEIKEKFSKACKDSMEYEKKQEAEIEENLIRLIKIRHYLWT